MEVNQQTAALDAAIPARTTHLAVWPSLEQTMALTETSHGTTVTIDASQIDDSLPKRAASVRAIMVTVLGGAGGWDALVKLWPLLPHFPHLAGVTIHHAGASVEAEGREWAASLAPLRWPGATGPKALVVCPAADAGWWGELVRTASGMRLVALSPAQDPYPTQDRDIDMDAFAVY